MWRVPRRTQPAARRGSPAQSSCESFLFPPFWCANSRIWRARNGGGAVGRRPDRRPSHRLCLAPTVLAAGCAEHPTIALRCDLILDVTSVNREVDVLRAWTSTVAADSWRPFAV